MNPSSSSSSCSFTPSKNYFIVFCELYNPLLHGDDSLVYGHYLVHSCYKHGYLYHNEEERMSHVTIATMKRIFFDEICAHWQMCKYHPFIRNYKHIVRNKKYVRPQIAQVLQLPTGHKVAILKTFWIAVIQRKWKKVYAERKHVLQLRAFPESLRHRELRGKWPAHLITLPGLRGMF